jgi:hypothetical protein
VKSLRFLDPEKLMRPSPKLLSSTKVAPMEAVFRNTHDSLVSEIWHRAEQNFTKRNFKEALSYYQYFKKYQRSRPNRDAWNE